MLTVTVIVPVRDEIGRIPAVLAGLEAQSRRPDSVVVADGRSQDGTREWLAQAALTRPWLRVVDNPRQIVPTGLNAALRAATGDIVARMDAHADYGPDYLERVVAVLESRPDVVGVGGLMETAGVGPWGAAFASVLSRPFGLGGARHRVGGVGGPIDHVFSGAYRRAAVEAIGGWDETMVANEDFEADYRLRQAGGVIWLEPSARTTWHTRESLPALSRQMWRYGRYKAVTLRMHPDSLRLRQLAPPALVVGLAGSTAVRPRPGLAMTAAYLVATGGLGARAASRSGASAVRGAVVPAVVHVSWALGLLSGIGATRMAPTGRAADSAGSSRPTG